MGWKKMGKKLHWHWSVSTTPLIGYFEPGKAAGQLVNLNQLHAIASWNLNFSFMAGENASSKKAFHNWLVGNLATWTVKLVNLVPVMATLFCRAFSTLATSRKWSGDPMRLISPKKLAKDIKTRSCKKKAYYYAAVCRIHEIKVRRVLLVMMGSFPELMYGWFPRCREGSTSGMSWSLSLNFIMIC